MSKTKQNITWTNPSVLKFSPHFDPIKQMEKKVRALVLTAMESGWSGPPFDPFQLAEILKIKVDANGEISDARTVPVGKGFRIEYNPNRPRGRVRFSIAHEIAHTLFEDCKETVRNRTDLDYSSDNWQLETLCNLGASEIVMPIGSNPNFEGAAVSIKQVLEQRREFDVSTEALLIRLAKLSNQNLSVFCASKIEDDLEGDKFRIDYSIPSSSWSSPPLSGMVFQSELLSHCTAIGYIVDGNEKLPLLKGKSHIQCVGLPPYPGNRSPRIAGIISNKGKPLVSNEIIYHEGDATKPGGKGNKIIAHIVNDKTANWGGAGFAVALKRKYPDIQKEFKHWSSERYENLTLGHSHFSLLDDGIYSMSMVAQHGYGKSSKPLIRYNALENCLDELKNKAIELDGASIHMPRIGVGNAGGDWEVVKELIHDKLIDNNVVVNIYDFFPIKK